MYQSDVVVEPPLRGLPCRATSVAKKGDLYPSNRDKEAVGFNLGPGQNKSLGRPFIILFSHVLINM